MTDLPPASAWMIQSGIESTAVEPPDSGLRITEGDPHISLESTCNRAIVDLLHRTSCNNRHHCPKDRTEGGRLRPLFAAAEQHSQPHCGTSKSKPPGNGCLSCTMMPRQ